MRTNKILIAAIAGGVATFFAGWLIYGMLLSSFFAANGGSATGVTKNPPDYVLLFVGQVALSLMIAYIFEKWAGIKTAISGAQAGAIIGFLMYLGVDLMIYSTSNISTLTATFADVIVSAIMAAISGAVVGFVLGR